MGLAERADRTFAFATYLHGRDMKTFGPHRIALTRRALALLGVLPEATGEGGGGKRARRRSRSLKSFRNLRRRP